MRWRESCSSSSPGRTGGHERAGKSWLRSPSHSREKIRFLLPNEPLSPAGGGIHESAPPQAVVYEYRSILDVASVGGAAVQALIREGSWVLGGLYVDEEGALR